MHDPPVRLPCLSRSGDGNHLGGAAHAAHQPAVGGRVLWDVLPGVWGCGAAIYSGKKVGNYGIALAFGLTVLTMAYAVGHISGGHFNPAITLGLAMGKRFSWKDVPAYLITHVVAAIGSASCLWVIAHGVSGFDSVKTGFASNGYGSRSPGGCAWWAVLLPRSC